MNVLIVLTFHVRRDEHGAFAQEFKERLGPALETARGFKQLHLVQKTNGSPEMLAVMEWSGDSMFHNFANRHNLYGDHLLAFAVPHTIKPHHLLPSFAIIKRKQPRPAAPHRDNSATR